MVKLKITGEQVEYLRHSIWRLYNYYKDEELPRCDDKDFTKMLMAFLEEFYDMLLKKAIQRKQHYTIKITPLWGFCIRLLFAGNVDRTTYSGAILSKLCDDIDRAYQ